MTFEPQDRDDATVIYSEPLVWPATVRLPVIELRV